MTPCRLVSCFQEKSLGKQFPYFSFSLKREYKPSVNLKTGYRSIRAGFTMVELLIVICIAVVLVGLALIWTARALLWSKERATMASLGYLHNAALRYNQAMPIALSDKDAILYQVNTGGGPRPLSSMEYFVLRAADIPDCAAQIEKVGRNFYVPVVPAADGSAAKFDIYVVATGALYRSQHPLMTVKDFKGTELKYCARASATDPVTVPPFDAAMAYSEYPYFASAGRDEAWGGLTNHDVAQPDANAKDNLYSFTEHQ